LTLRWKLFGSWSSPPRRFTLTILHKYGYHAVNVGKSDPLFGQECDLNASVADQKTKSATKSIFFHKSGFWPLTLARPDPKYPLSAGRSHLLRDDARPRYPLTVAGYPPGLHCSRVGPLLSLTLNGAFGSIEGSEVWFALHFRRLFDIVIRRKGNADGGVLACRFLLGPAMRL